MSGSSRSLSGAGSGVTDLEEPDRSLGYPTTWLLIVGLPAAAYSLGLALFLRASEAESLPGALWWAGAPAGASLVLGVVGGFVFMKVMSLAAIGAAIWATILTFSLSSVWWTAVSDDSGTGGGEGLLFGMWFVASFGPMLAGAAYGYVLREAPSATVLTTLAAVAMGGLSVGLLWLLGLVPV